MAPRLTVPFTVVAALILSVLSPLPAAAVVPGPPVFGPETFTSDIGNPVGTPEEVDCPANSVLRGIAADTDDRTYKDSGSLQAVRARCSEVSVSNSGAITLGALVDAGDVGVVNKIDATSDCPADFVVVGLAGTGDPQVDSLNVRCAKLRPDGTLGEVIDGPEIGRPDPYETYGPHDCPAGAVATGMEGTSRDDPYKRDVKSLKLRCQPIYFPSVRPEDVNLTWATALTVGANSATSGRITAPGQDRWYRFPIQPGSRVTVELTDLPADYDMTLFKDIGQAFEELTSTDDLVKLSAEFAGDAYAPSVFSPSVFSPSVFSPSVFSPSVFSPSVFSPSVFSPSVFSPSVFSPSVFSPSVFSPSVFSPSVFSPAVSLPSVFSPSVFSPSVFSPSVFSDAFASAQTRSVIGISSRDGTATESLSSATWNNTGFFYVRVQGRNGFFAPDGYTLNVSTVGGICSGPLNGFTDTPTVVGDPGSARTVILTDPGRMPGTPAENAALGTALTAFAAQVDGAIVDLGQSEKVQALQDQADSPAAISCPYAKNLVAEAIRDIVNSYRDDGSTLQYVVIIGDDSVVPFFRYPDNAGLGPEDNYAPPVADDTASEASLRGNYVLGQDAYGSASDVAIKGTEVPIADLAVGRLVESPVDITAVLQRYLARDGAPLTPTSTLATGYDFLTDAADSVAADFRAGIPGGRHDTLITDADVPPSTVTQGAPSRRESWTATDLRNSLLGARHDLIFLAGHFSANNTLAADYETTVNSTELANAPDGNFTDALVFSVGCHSGYTIVDDEGVPGVTVGLDWTEAFVKEGATLIAGTGYQYGDTDFTEYSERLYADFARQLRIGTGAVPVGQALLRAKQNYLAGTPTLQGIDQKSIIEATLYGLPMLGVTLPGKIADPSDEPLASPAPVGTDPGNTLGLQVDDLSLSPTLTPQTKELINLDGGTLTASWLTGPDGVSVNPAEPALPLLDGNVTVPDQVLRGVALRSGSYTDTDGITPLTGAPATETHSVHTPFVTPAFFPGKIASVNYFDALTGGGSTRLMLTPVQHRSDGPGSLTTTQRRFDTVGLRLFYSGNIETYGANVPALAAPPSITDVRTVIDGNTVDFSARVVGNPAAGIQEVFVTYTGQPGSEFHEEWASLDLTQDADDSTLWTATLTLPTGQEADDVRYLVQAVNGVGLVGIDDNQGTYFTPGIIPGLDDDDLDPTSLELAGGNPDAAEYGEFVTVRATLTDDTTGNGLADRAVTFAVGGSSRTAFTNGAGVAEAELPMSVPPGEYDLVASYDGDSDTAPTSDTATGFTVRKQPTTLSLAVAYGIASATLRGSNDLPLREKVVYFAYADAAGTVLAGRTVITNYRGVAELPLSAPPTGATQIRAYFGVAETPVPGGEAIDLSDVNYAPAGPVSADLPSTVPVARPDNYSVVEGETLTVAAPGVLGNDTDAETASLVSGPARGELDLRSDGSFTYSPPDDFVGTVTFTYVAEAAGQQSEPAAVTITVTELTPDRCTILGTAGDDTLTGTSKNDVICGLGGDDKITGGNGKDLIIAGPGDDTVSGDNGTDVIRAGPGKDKANGDNGSDLLDLRDGAAGDVGDGGSGKDEALSDPGDTLISVP